MNIGLIKRGLRETWPTTAVMGAILLVIETVMGYALPTYGQQLADQWQQMPFIQNVLKAVLGTDMIEGIGISTFHALCWVHPVVMALLWAHAIMLCTRVPAGEVDRGTIDILLGLPISRWQLFVAETTVWVASGACVLALGWAGNALGNAAVPMAARPPAGTIVIVLVNVLALYLAVGAGALVVSAFSDRRGKAIAIVFTVMLAAFLLNYLAQFWRPAEQMAFLSPMHYHRPLQVMHDGAWPVRDIAVLTGVAAAFWITGGVVFARRDLCTV